mmetsp:Transcript_16495/g.18336  ORF Transcript_16495/g.18336 Transcript_16495/m.18336 type:complete len:163 (-) Transcript_16495:142-630(-)
MAKKPYTTNSSTLEKFHLLELPVELHLCIIDLDVELYLIWPLLSKYSATTTRFNQVLEKHGTWRKISKRNTEKPSILVSEHYRHGKLHGERKVWHNNGILYEQMHYVDGKKEGEHKTWYFNGKCAQCHYVNGSREGDCTWDFSRIPFEQSYYVKDPEDAIYI